MNQATVYEQQIIRDQGEDFKKRVRQTMKAFDQYENPLRLGIKSLVKEIIESLVPVDSEIQNSLINSCYYRYLTKFEDQHYRFTLQSLNYIFENEKVLQFSNELNYKYIALIFIQQLRAYFIQQNDRNLQKLYQRLEGIKKEKEKDEYEEGFWDDEGTENQSQLTRVKGVTNKKKEQDENEFCHTKKEMKLKEMQIKSLQTKLFHREQNLVQITSGYLKDIQLLREQLYRKESSAINYQECYDVTYLDFTEVLDPSIKSLLQLHIKDLKLQFENRTIDYVRMIATQKNEIQQQKNLVSKLQNQINYIESPSELIQKLLKMDENPYRIWKYIADIKGNLFFKEVFEFQKSIYGLNYSEINKLLMTNKGYERDYNNYKESLYTEIQLFYTKCSNELTAYKEQYLLSEKQRLEAEENQSNIRSEFLQQAMTLFNNKNEEQISILQTQVKNKLELLEHITLKADQEKLKYMFKLWNVIIRVQKGEELQKILIDQSFIDERLQEQSIEIGNQKQLIQNLQNTNQELILQLVDTQQQLSIINQNQLSWPKQIYELQYANIKLSNQLRQSNQSKDLLESFNSKLIRIIDSKLSNLKLTEINLDDISNITKSVMDNIKQLSTQQLKQINSIQQTGLFTLQAYQQLIYNGMINQETQTDPILIQDKKSTLSVQEDNFPQLLILNSIDSQKQSQSQNQQKTDPKNQSNIQSNIQSSQQSEQPIKSQKKKNQQFMPNQINKSNLTNVENQQEYEQFSKNDLDNNQQSLPIQNNKITIRNPITSNHPESRGKYTESTHNQSRTNNSNTNKQDANIDIKTTQFKLEQNDQSNVIELIEYEEDQYDKRDLKVSSQTERIRSKENQSRRLVNGTVNYSLIPGKSKNSGEFRDPYKRLYQDSLEKESRIKSLRQNLDLLEKSHWEDIINLFSIEYQGIDKQTQQIQRTPDIPFRHKETTSFRTKCFRQYYEKSKSQTPNQGRYKTWIFKQTNCIDHMFGQIEQVQNQFERVSRTADFENQGMLPESIRNLMSQKKQR